MPAVEQTYRSTKLLHKIFGVTSFVMLIATIWMFAADHNREWKPIQRTADNIEIKMTAWRELQYTTEEAVHAREVLEAKLDAAQRRPISAKLLADFEAEVHAVDRTKDLSLDSVKEWAAEIESNAGTPKAESWRNKVLNRLRNIVRDARFQEEKLLGERKFKSAKRDAAVAELGILVRDGHGEKELQAKQSEINEITLALQKLTEQYQLAKDHRVKLDRILQQITQEEDAIAEALDKNKADLVQLEKTIDTRKSTYINWVGFVPLPGKRFLELPILDAFNSPRKIDNLWSKGLEIDYNFSKVRRFDRCTTCHQAMQKSMPGSAVDPAYDGESLIDFQIAIVKPEGAAETATSSTGAADATAPVAATGVASPEVDQSISADKQLERQIGLRIATEGLINRTDATVQFIRPETPAAQARAPLNDTTVKQAGDVIRKSLLMSAGHMALGQVRPGILVGDVIVAINGDPVTEPRKVIGYLLDVADAGKDFSITVRRGLPNPYTSHPRLDLYVGSLSPHKMSEFACTICHEGQGSATAFKFASHTPTSERQRKEWVFEHNWFDNVHWTFPMYPERFAESACLKCHHGVTELESSPQFADAPGPKVVHGYHLIRKYGCFGCHEINGYDSKRRIGPDLRLEPNVFAAALQLKADPGFAKLSAEEQDWVNQLVDHPDRDATRYRVLETLELDAKSDQPRLSPVSLDVLTPLFRDIESPGQLRKAGPSLRFVAAKNDAAFLYDWIREPKHFRPSTRMPQFFGLNKHLEGSPGLEAAKQFEPIEILGLATYLQIRSQKFDFLEPPAGVTELADAGRGKTTFQTRGCLTCHNHKAFADTDAYRNPDDIVQGPDLSGVGDKFVGENGRKWLYSWIKQPSRYHARTLMPDLFLDSIATQDAEKKDHVSDPAADIVEFLLSESKTGWKPAEGTLTNPTDVEGELLDRFVKLNLVEAFAVHRADKFATKGIPESMRGELKGAEIELLVSDDQHQDKSFELTREQKLVYIGSKTIAKFGCYGCHDIPGFEDARPIGTVLADWGRKDSARLAFEHITHYLEHGHGHASDAGPASGNSASGAAEVAHHENDRGDESAADKEYYVSLLKSGNRAGFLYQKLLEPRSYDYHKTENKKYSERLRMPQFPFNSHDREAVITFVLGLVADPPNDKYIYKPTDRAKALLAGREVLEKYNCGGCHILSPEKWNVVFEPGRFGEQSAVKTYPFLKSHFPPQALQESAKADRSGLIRTSVYGVPAVDDSGTPIVYDDAGDPLDSATEYESRQLELSFELWKPAAIEGKPFDVGVLPLNIPAGLVERKFGTDGGFLTKYLLPHVVALEKQVNPAAKGTEAWGWLPPPLINQGQKVQTDWLHSFLLNPYPIRPATFLRMPRFNMSPAEATQLVNYFAAVDSAEYPYAYSSRRQPDHLARVESEYERDLAGAEFEGKPRTRLDDAMRVVVNNNYCVKCHLMGDFTPTGSDRAKAPNLALVHRRLRPEYMRNWIANPKTYLPYTSMPVNVPYDPDLPNQGGVAQDLFHGTSTDQVDGLVDLLMNFDEYTKQRSSVATLVKQYGGPVAPATPAAAAPAASGGGN